MGHTVVGFFDDATEAQNAVSELVKFGIQQNQIDVSNGSLAGNDSVGSSAGKEEKKSGIARFFDNLFGNDSDDAKKYSSVGESANTIVTVHVATEEEAEEAADILDDLGAFNIDERATQHGFFANEPLDTNDSKSDSDQAIQNAQEELQVGKRSVETGGVRVRSRIVERPVAEDIRLRREHVRHTDADVENSGNTQGVSNTSDSDDFSVSRGPNNAGGLSNTRLDIDEKSDRLNSSI